MCLETQAPDLVNIEKHQYESRSIHGEQISSITHLTFLRAGRCYTHRHCIPASAIIVSFSSSTKSIMNFPVELELWTLEALSTSGLCAATFLTTYRAWTSLKRRQYSFKTYDKTGGDHGYTVHRKAPMDLFGGRYYARKPHENIYRGLLSM